MHIKSHNGEHAVKQTFVSNNIAVEGSRWILCEYVDRELCLIWYPSVRPKEEPPENR
jgi:hypothetical protein